MNENEFKKLIKKDKYQIFLFESPASLPLSFFVHNWFVCVEEGKVSKWELFFDSNRGGKSFGHLHINFGLPTKGIELFHLYGKYFWEGKLLKSIEGDKNSLAEKMINFIKKTPKTYPYCNKYHLVPGPNSNTYIQWIIDHFPKSGFKLSWRAIGKNYKVEDD